MTEYLNTIMAYQFDRIKVLVAEDAKPMQDILRALLTTFGVGEVHLARDGKEAYEIFKRVNPDIVIADWMMTPVDGIGLCKLIRTDPRSPNPYVPIIMMTGYTERRRVFKARDAGITEFLVKPFTAQQLFKRIAQVIERPRQFVRSEDFFGPDRRRTIEQNFDGIYKRENDPAETAPRLRKESRIIIINPEDEIDLK